MNKGCGGVQAGEWWGGGWGQVVQHVPEFGHIAY